ncbi:ABC transporter permease, partial [Azospirillum brasilense]|nr:ABC transporter permease [Azospirillum brasilense]
MARFSFSRFVAVMVKEFIQMRRDRLTFAMMVGVPVLQLVLFGFAINSDPKSLPTAVHAADSSPFARTLVSAMANSGYFDVTSSAGSPAELDRLLAEGRVQFAVTIPAGFARDLQRGERPVLWVAPEPTDPRAPPHGRSALG